MDFRPGGKWRIEQRGPDGEHAFYGEFREIVRPGLIAWTFEWGGAPGHVSVDTVRFVEEDGRTTVTVTSLFDSVEDRDGMLTSGMEEGAGESYDRLEEYLEVLSTRAQS
jgi:uncharacterized protein YndB with AHSA1/START domain